LVAAEGSAVEADSVVAVAGLAAAAHRGAGDMNMARLFRHWISLPWRMRRFFSSEALKRIEGAIAKSETRHGGQIRFAVEHALDTQSLLHGLSARERALEVFSVLNVWDTEHNNGVLIYLLLADRDVEIIADRGIHGRVGLQGWEAICREMESAFREGRFEQGALSGIERVSVLLEGFFPKDDRTSNELSDRPVLL
jgi:uncharacterized membrane protein